MPRARASPPTTKQQLARRSITVTLILEAVPPENPHGTADHGSHKGDTDPIDPAKRIHPGTFKVKHQQSWHTRRPSPGGCRKCSLAAAWIACRSA